MSINFIALGKAIFIDKKIQDNLFGVLVLVMFADQRGSVLWSSIFVTFVAKKNHWIVTWILPESPVYVKDASHRLGAALSLTYTKPSW